jgi:hypothetical protein
MVGHRWSFQGVAARKIELRASHFMPDHISPTLARTMAYLLAASKRPLTIKRLERKFRLWLRLRCTTQKLSYLC